MRQQSSASKVEELCRTYTSLTAAEVAIVLDYAAQIQSIADLTNADIFIDCLVQGKPEAVIVAEARPQHGYSLYKESVLGKFAYPDYEPGVFATFRDGVLFHGMRALTQENISVRQDVVPIKNSNGQVIAALIKEEDITERISQSKKYESMLQTNLRLQETLNSLEQPEMPAAERMDFLQQKEMNHRIKNNLQMIAGILNMEARRAAQPELTEILEKNAGRILTIATIHDILSQTGADRTLELKSLLQHIVAYINDTHNAASCAIDITLQGDDCAAPVDFAVAFALSANELIMNACKHAFVGRHHGQIKVSVENTPAGRALTVQDDGIGFPAETIKYGLGLRIVEMTVREKLKGQLFVSRTQNNGSSVRIECK